VADKYWNARGSHTDGGAFIFTIPMIQTARAKRDWSARINSAEKSKLPREKKPAISPAYRSAG
jgi:hypothetical protein